MQSALQLAQGRLYDARVRGWDDLPDVEALRDRARTIRTTTIDELDRHLDRFQEQVEALGGQRHRCDTAEEAAGDGRRDLPGAPARSSSPKSKSMVTEEIRLNEALEAAGIRAVETDLGEYILQLAGEHPVHIVAPAIEKTAEQVADLFTRVAGAPTTAGLEDLTRTARGNPPGGLPDRRRRRHRASTSRSPRRARSA